MSILNTIIEKKKERLREAKRKYPLSAIKKRIEEIEEARDFERSITKASHESLRLIAELKKASPSKGLIRKDFDPKSISSVYSEKKVNAISVLTEEDFFQGSPDYIKIVKENAQSPVLRKDFIFDEYQIYESKAWGADALLLIAASLSRSQAEELLSLAAETGLSVLFETHTLKELDTAIYLNCKIIGVNNRDLNTLEIDLNRGIEMIKDIPSDRITVCESGIRTREEVKTIEEAGAHAILVGTTIMKSPDIGKAIDELVNN